LDNSINKQRRTRKLIILGWVAIACLVIAALEIISYVFLTTFASSRVAYLTFQPPVFPSRDDYEDYLAERHPVLGWPGADDEAPETPSARNVPGYTASADACITSYGDSFVYGNEVEAEEAWSNYLSARMGCRVGNYGVSAYGTGQALLRFQINEDDLGSFSGNPDKFLQHEAYLPDSTLGPVSIEFPYSVKVLRIALKDEVRNWIAKRPAWSNAIQPGDPSGSLEVTVAIASKFMRLCQDREKECFIVLFPAETEYDYFHRTQDRIIQPLLDEFDRRSIPFLDLTPPFHKVLVGAPIGTFLIGQGHFNAAGNRIVADLLYEYLTSKGYLFRQPNNTPSNGTEKK